MLLILAIHILILLFLQAYATSSQIISYDVVVVLHITSVLIYLGSLDISISDKIVVNLDAIIC